MSEVLTTETIKEIDHWLSKFPVGKQRSAIIGSLHAAQHQNHGFLTSELMDANYNGNKNLHFQGYDKDNQYIGQYNKLDEKFNENCKGLNLNAMHTCWSGEEASKSALPGKIN